MYKTKMMVQAHLGTNRILQQTLTEPPEGDAVPLVLHKRTMWQKTH